MTAEKKYTERDLVMAKREGWAQGRHEALTSRPLLAGEREGYARAAAILYPLPKVTRPRVVSDPASMPGTREWRCAGGELQTRRRSDADQAWYGRHNAFEFNGRDFPAPTPERVAMWADLLANPTEECDA